MILPYHQMVKGFLKDKAVSKVTAKKKTKARPRSNSIKPSHLKIRNPIRGGYSAATVSANVAELIRQGHAQNQAVKISLESARKAWRKRYPRAAFPHHLAQRNPVKKKNSIKPSHQDEWSVKAKYRVFHAKSSNVNVWHEVARFMLKADAVEYAKAAHKAHAGLWKVATP